MTELDLTPRDLTPKPARRNWLPIIAIVVIAAALVGVLIRTLDGAALFIYNADQAIEQRDDLGDARFRLQGSPIGNTVEGLSEGGRNGIGFTVNFNGELVDVVHLGSPAESFQSGVPVVLEGTWHQGVRDFENGAADGYYFVSDNMIVSHDNDYRIDNEQRINDAVEGGAVPAP